jgi:cvfA/B/C family virulence factor
MAGTLTVIWWRDIPAQVIAREGRRAHKIALHPRFQVAIDRAAEKAGKRSMDEYVGEWRKENRRCGDDLEAEVQAEATRLEAEYDQDVLNGLVLNGGVKGALVQ